MTQHILRKLEGNNNNWSIDGRIFRTDGGLYTALDIGLAFALGETTLRDLPDKPWQYDKQADTYSIEIDVP